MESGLLRLTEETVEEEVIHTLFRAAHSIKGGSGTFGFHELTALTHVMEHVLEEVRGGTRPVTQQLVELLFQAVDCSRDMLVALRDRV
jgi:two-component system chemotaxis sensor kinase CheA